MTDRLTYLLARLSGRERVLRGLLVGIVLPVAVVFLVVQPMQAAREAAKVAAFEARVLRDWVAEQVAELPPEGLAAPVEETVLREPIGISGIEQSLVREGLREQVAQLSNRSGGGVDLAFEAVSFETLTFWLQDTTPTWGYRIAAFRIERGAETGLVAASFELEAAE